MNKRLVSILGIGVLLLSTAAASATDLQGRHSAPGTERNTVGRRLGEEPAKNTYFAPVRTVATAQQSSFVTKALSFKLPTKASAKAPVSRSAAKLPKLQGNVTYSDAWTPTTYPTVGVYTVPTSADETFEMLIDSPNGNRGGVVKDGIYFCHTYENFMGMFNYYDIFGYDLSSGAKVFEYNGPNVGCMTQGLAVDPTDNTVYGLFYREDGEGIRLATIDYKTAENDVAITAIADLEGRWNALACSSQGQLYGIQVDQDATTNEVKSSSLCKIDKVSGAVENVGITGQLPFYYTGATIDTKTDRMFWTVAPANQTGALCEVSLSTGLATVVYNFPANEEVTALWVPAPEAEDGAPAVATDLLADFAEGSLSGTVSFTAPSTTFDGSAATGEISYTVLLNGEIAAQGTTNYGAKTTATVTAPAAADYEISVTTANAAGTSPVAKISTFIGKGVPASPAPVLSYENGTMSLSWPAVTTSANGGYIDPASVTYVVTRYPEGAVVAENLAATTFSEPYPMPAELTQVRYSVAACYGENVSEPAMSNGIVLGSVSLPYSQDFADESALDVYTIVDGNNDGLLWGIDNGAAYLRFNMSLQLDDWMILPPVELKKGQSYRLSFDAYAQNQYAAETIEVKYGTSNTAAAMTTTVMEPTDLTTVEPTRYEFDLTPDADGRYYIGFHGISQPDTYGLFVDNIHIAEGFAVEGPAAVADFRAVPDPDGLAKIELSFTTPTKTFSGKNLTEISKVELYGGDELLNTFTAPAVGSNLTYTDTREGKGPRTYTAVCYNAAGRGVPASINSYCGVDIPGITESVSFVETANEGEVTVSWTAIAADQNGNAVNPDKLKYNLYVVENGQLVSVASEIAATSYTIQAVEKGQQRFAQYAVTGVSEAGEGQPNGSDMRAVGTPYASVHESFANKELGNYIWGMARLVGQPNFGIYGPADFKIDGVDLDGGFFVFQAGGNQAGESGALMSGKVAIPANGTVGLSLSAFCNGDDDANELEIRVAEVNGDFKSLGVKAVNATDKAAGWHKLWWDMSEYAGKNVSVQIVGTIRVYSTLLIDNIRIGQLYKHDLSVLSFSVPEKAKYGERYVADAIIFNDGLEEVPAFGLSISTNQYYSVEKTEENLAPGTWRNVEFECLVLPPNDESSELQDIEHDLLVTYAQDEYLFNNKGLAKMHLVESSLPGVTDLHFEEGASGVVLSWSEPDMTNVLPEATEESFESGESFAKEFEGWTFVDVDKQAVGGSYAFEIPGIVTGSTPASFVVFDTTDPKYNLTAHSGNKMLASFFVYDGGQTDDWAISPELSGNAQTVSFYARSYMSFMPETIEVYYSTGSTDPADFVLAKNATVVPEAWTKYTAELPAGAKHFAVRSCATDGYFLFLDDFEFEAAPLTGLVLLGYDAYCSYGKINEELITDTTLDVTSFLNSRHEVVPFVVMTIYKQGISRPSNICDLILSVGGIDDNDIQVAAVGQKIVITGAEGKAVSVHSVDGKCMFSGVGMNRTTVELSAGVFIVRAGSKIMKLILQ